MPLVLLHLLLRGRRIVGCVPLIRVLLAGRLLLHRDLIRGRGSYVVRRVEDGRAVRGVDSVLRAKLGVLRRQPVEIAVLGSRLLLRMIGLRLEGGRASPARVLTLPHLRRPIRLLRLKELRALLRVVTVCLAQLLVDIEIGEVKFKPVQVVAVPVERRAIVR